MASSVTPVGPVSLSSTAYGVQHVEYQFSFTTSGTGGLSSTAPADTIRIDAPGGTVLQNSYRLRDDTTGQDISTFGALSNVDQTLTLTLCCSEVINPGDQVTITLNDVQNPPSGGPFSLNLSTSKDTGLAPTPTYALTTPEQITAPTGVTLSSEAIGVAHVKYQFGFKTSANTGGLANKGTITIDAPAGTVLKDDVQARDVTANNSLSFFGTLSNSDRTLTLEICCGDEVPANHEIAITLNDVTNPPAAGPHRLTLSTSSNPTPVQTTAPGYTLTAAEQITAPTGVTLSSEAIGVAHVKYQFGFKTSANTGGLANKGTITIDAPAGTVLKDDV